MAPERFSCDLPPAARSVTEARRFVRRALTSWGLEALSDTTALLTSEVVTNAVLHARTAMQLTIRRVVEGVRVDVSDGSLRRPTRRLQTAEATHGRGLDLLDRLAADWQVTDDARGKTLSFTVSATSDPWAAYSASDWQASL
jgi:anti-sigma regulatory factor (Ser/Thr protein kinase)